MIAAEPQAPALPPARVLLVDDDELFRESVGGNLRDAGFAVDEAASGPAELHRLAAGGGPDLVVPDLVVPDLVVLDWKMPGMSGIEVLRRLRRDGLTMPVIFLTVLGNQIYEEAALQGGAVDFVDKSRSFSILLKRITLILHGRKGEGLPAATGPLPGAVLHRAALELHRDCCRAFWGGNAVALTITEFRLVELLAARAGQDVGYRDLYDMVHGSGFTAGYGEEGYRANVRAFVKRIRRKFREVDENFDHIESYSGFGYRWHHPDEADS